MQTPSSIHLHTIYHPRFSLRSVDEHIKIILRHGKANWLVLRDEDTTPQVLVAEAISAINDRGTRNTAKLFIRCLDDFCDSAFYAGDIVKIEETTKDKLNRHDPLLPQYYEQVFRNDTLHVDYSILLSRICTIDPRQFMHLVPKEEFHSNKYRYPFPMVVYNADSTHPNIFKNEGHFWTLSFEGCAREIHVKDSVNLRYIACLLQHQGHEFHALELENVVRGNFNGSELESDITASQEQGMLTTAKIRRAQILKSVTGGFKEKVLPMKLSLDELQEELRDAEQEGDIEKTDVIKDKICILRKDLKEALSSDERKQAGKIDCYIRRALDEIKAASRNNLALYNHLKTHLTPIRFPISYNPENRFYWDVEL